MSYVVKWKNCIATKDECAKSRSFSDLFDAYQEYKYRAFDNVVVWVECGGTQIARTTDYAEGRETTVTNGNEIFKYIG